MPKVELSCHLGSCHPEPIARHRSAQGRKPPLKWGRIGARRTLTGTPGTGQKQAVIPCPGQQDVTQQSTADAVARTEASDQRRCSKNCWISGARPRTSSPCWRGAFIDPRYRYVVAGPRADGSRVDLPTGGAIRLAFGVQPSQLLWFDHGTNGLAHLGDGACGNRRRRCCLTAEVHGQCVVETAWPTFSCRSLRRESGAHGQARRDNVRPIDLSLGPLRVGSSLSGPVAELR